MKKGKKAKGNKTKRRNRNSDGVDTNNGRDVALVEKGSRILREEPMTADHSKEAIQTDFGTYNLAVFIDDAGIVTLRFDTNRTVAKAGERNKRGETRKRDLVSTSAGFIRVGPCTVCLNALRA